MTDLNRRSMLKALAAAPAAAGFAWTEAEAQQAHHQAQAARQKTATKRAPFKPQFFTAHEYATVMVLVDLIIPKDDRSGSATDAGVPEFMDFMMVDQPARQTAMRGGLAWLDHEAQRRADKTFVASTDAERRALLDAIAWPNRKVAPELQYGVTFFNMFRDLTASGFYTSRIGMDDLQFIGNTFVLNWKG